VQAELADMARAPEYLRLDIGWLKMRRAGSGPRPVRLIAIEFLPMTAQHKASPPDDGNRCQPPLEPIGYLLSRSDLNAATKLSQRRHLRRMMTHSGRISEPN
jgi:hypothetical protein